MSLSCAETARNTRGSAARCSPTGVAFGFVRNVEALSSEESKVSKKEKKGNKEKKTAEAAPASGAKEAKGRKGPQEPSRLKVRYGKEVVPALMKHFKYSNIMAVPKLEKIVINMG